MGEKTRRLEDRLPLEEVPYLNNRNSRKRKEKMIMDIINKIIQGYCPRLKDMSFEI